MFSLLVDAVYLLRHGETVNGQCYIGHLDVALSDLGRKQMEVAAMGIGGWDVIVTSPLIRCAEFSRQLAQRLNIPLITEPDIREIGFGRWEGLDFKTIRARYPEQYRAFLNNPEENTPPGGESLLIFRQRVLTAWKLLQQQYAGQKILLVVHGGTIRALLQEIYSMSWTDAFAISVRHGCMICIEQDRNSFRTALPYQYLNQST
ncbi:MAG: alpha-ribazole phosphatase family protein [Gammaproteobacteria bacterium]|nr:MAG: alpha-ribazole phosphatase family protein [Gammaproteobacteria bacterium]